MSGKLLNVNEAAAWASVSKSFLNQQRMAGGGKGPPAVRVGRAVRYRLADLEAWSASLSKVDSAEQEGGQ